MTKPDYQKKYAELYGEAPKETVTVPQLKKLIEAKEGEGALANSSKGGAQTQPPQKAAAKPKKCHYKGLDRHKIRKTYSPEAGGYKCPQCKIVVKSIPCQTA